MPSSESFALRDYSRPDPIDMEPRHVQSPLRINAHSILTLQKSLHRKRRCEADQRYAGIDASRSSTPRIVIDAATFDEGFVSGDSMRVQNVDASIDGGVDNNSVPI